eukprot:3863101-Pyramimonas_sp.AAC.1
MDRLPSRRLRRRKGPIPGRARARGGGAARSAPRAATRSAGQGAPALRRCSRGSITGSLPPLACFWGGGLR